MKLLKNYSFEININFIGHFFLNWWILSKLVVIIYLIMKVAGFSLVARRQGESSARLGFVATRWKTRMYCGWLVWRRTFPLTGRNNHSATSHPSQPSWFVPLLGT